MWGGSTRPLSSRPLFSQSHLISGDMMTELERIILTSGLTICGSVVVLVAGQVVIRFFIDPIIKLREMIGDIADTIIFYASIYANPGVASDEDSDEASDALRQKASLLRARANAVPLYRLFSFFRIVPNQKAIAKASRNLIGLSNSVHQGDAMENHDRQDQIRKALCLPEV